MRKIFVVKQRDLRDCGPCCILSILKYYKGYVPIENIRMDCYTNNQGTSAYHMVNALKKYGFDSYGAMIEEKNFNEKDVVLPLIAHLNLKTGQSHYVVVYKINKKQIIVMDPYKGIVKMSYDEFYAVFSKIIIVCYPKENLILKEKKIENVTFLWQLLKENKSLFIKILLSGVLLVLFTIINGLYFKIGFNQLNDSKALKLCSILFGFIIISKILFEFLSQYFKNYLVKNIDYVLNQKLFQKIFYLPSKIVKNRSIGEIVTRVQELNNLHEMIAEILVDTIINIFLAITTFIILYFISSYLLKIVCIFTFIYMLLCLFSNKSIYKIIRKNIESNEMFNGVVIEQCNALNSIKNNNIESFSLEKTLHHLIKYLQSNFLISNTLNIINTLKSIIIELLYFIITTVGFYLIIKNKLSLINFMTFESILVYLIEPIKNIMAILPKYNYLKASLEKIIEFLSLKEENLEKKEYFLNGDIQIKHLEYSYNDYHPIIKNLNLEIKENEHVMLSGNSGCGKSTFCKILNRTNSYTKGNIKVNGIELKDYALKTIRESILYLSQNEFIFDDTIKNNIILDKKFQLNKFNFICKLCHLDDFINTKPLRYETFLNKDFTNLSGGEKQRIILARALYRDCKILILDEALSEVNIDLESSIICNLNTYFKNKTLIYVTHKKHGHLFDRVITLGETNAKL